MRSNIIDFRYYLSAESQLFGVARERFLVAEREYREMHIESLTRLLKSYDDLSPSGKFVALVAIRDRRSRPAVPLLFRELLSEDPLLSGMASAGVGAILSPKENRRVQ